MSAFEIFAIAWIPISCGLIVGFGFLLGGKTARSAAAQRAVPPTGARIRIDRKLYLDDVTLVR